MARTTFNMSLRLWDQLSDRYDNQQLSGNFAKIDVHDHTSGHGPQVPGAGIEDGSITVAKLAGGIAVPTGAVIMYGGATAPSGYLMCDGTSYGRLSYPTLYAAIGTA